MSRPARAEIDLQALKTNLRRVRQAAPTSRVVAVIKANGYGHGIGRVAHALSGADAFGVACIDEAIELRQTGLEQRIVLLEGVFEPDEMLLVQKYKLDVVVHQQQQIDILEHVSTTPNSHPHTVTTWLKIDTGMHRLGFNPDESTVLYHRLLNCSIVDRSIIMMTHLANADDRNDDTTLKQLSRFDSVSDGLVCERSIANSGGILGWPQSHREWVRPGIMLYGITPFNDGVGKDLGLVPVMTVKSRLFAIHNFSKGDPIGYGGAWVCPEDMRVGVVAFGYGDGYPRQAVNGTPVLVNGQRTPLIGRVSMDMICVDLRTQPNAKVGDTVELWGKNLPAEEVAKHASTIAYDLVCGITQRVKLIYL